MRWLLAALLAANMIYLASSLFSEKHPDEPPTEEWLGSGLTLLSEAEIEPGQIGTQGSGDEELELIQPIAVPSFAALRPAESLLCVQLGPMASPEALEVGLEQLAEHGVKGKLVWKEEVVRREYWVYLPASAISGSAQRLVNEMQARGVDSFLIMEGELRGGISLGIFRRLSSAERLQERREEQGYEAHVHEFVRWGRVPWVGLEPLSASRWGELKGEVLSILQEGFEEELEVLEPPCGGVASSNGLG